MFFLEFNLVVTILLGLIGVNKVTSISKKTIIVVVVVIVVLYFTYCRLYTLYVDTVSVDNPIVTNLKLALLLYGHK